MTFTTEQLGTPVEGLTVQDAILGIKTVDRLAKSGVLGTELVPLGWFRERMRSAVKNAIGVDYDVSDTAAAEESN